MNDITIQYSTLRIESLIENSMKRVFSSEEEKKLLIENKQKLIYCAIMFFVEVAGCFFVLKSGFSFATKFLATGPFIGFGISFVMSFIFMKLFSKLQEIISYYFLPLHYKMYCLEELIKEIIGEYGDVFGFQEFLSKVSLLKVAPGENNTLDVEYKDGKGSVIIENLKLKSKAEMRLLDMVVKENSLDFSFLDREINCKLKSRGFSQIYNC